MDQDVKLTKNQNTKATLAKTKARRKTQVCLVREIKLAAPKDVMQTTHDLFKQSKWLANHIIGDNLIFDPTFNTKIKQVPVRWIDENSGEIITEIRDLTLPAQIKQAIHQELKDNITGLHVLKSKGYRVGKLKFKKEVNSINLKQYGVSHKIIDSKHVHITGIGKVRAYGLDQIDLQMMEPANAKLVRRASGIYLMLTVYVDKQLSNIRVGKGKHEIKKSPHIDAVGIDMGIKSSITTSDGFEAHVCIKEPDTLKQLQRQHARLMRINKTNKRTKQQLNGKKWSNKVLRLKKALKREYEHVTNQKMDMANKIVSVMTATYKKIAIQDENLRGWHAGWYSRQVQSSCLGTLKAKLKSKGAVVVGRFEPTTKQCYVCGTSNAIGLDDRVYECSTCGHTEHRDVKAAKTIMQKANMRVPDGIIMETKPFNYSVKVYSNIKQERNDSCDEVIPSAINHCKVVDSKVLLMTQNKKEEASSFRAR